MIAAVYARRSPNEQEDRAADAKSVTRQVTRAKEYAARHGWSLPEEHIYIDDLISGAEWNKRPALKRLLTAALDKPRFSRVIVSEMSRLGRDTLRTLSAIQTLEDSGIQVYGYLDDRRISVDGEMGEAESFLKAWAASSEQRKAGQRTRDAIKLRAEQGKPTGGPPPYGYTDRNGKRKINPEQAKVIKRIYRRRAEGALGFYRLARELERDGIASPSGQSHWFPSQVARILQNESYRGYVLWAKTRNVRRHGSKTTVRSPENLIRRADPKLRIVADKLWAAVQAMKPARTPGASRKTSSRHLLSPFLRCGSCGSSMYATKTAYTCIRRHMLGKAKCSARSIPMEAADKAIMRELEKALAGHVVLSKAKEMIEERRAQVDVKALQRQGQRIRGEMTTLVDRLAQGADVEEVRAGIDARKARLAAIDEALAGRDALKKLDMAEFNAKLTPVLKSWRDHLKREPARAQQVLRKVLPVRLTVTAAPDGGWEIEGDTSYTDVLRELGLDAERLLASLERHSKLAPASTRRR